MLINVDQFTKMLARRIIRLDFIFPTKGMRIFVLR